MGHPRFNTSILAIVSCLLWSSAFAGVKIGLEFTTPLQFAGTRFFISGLLVFPLALRINPRYFRIVKDQWKTILLISFLQTFLQYAMFYTGINLIPAAVGAIVIGSQPLFIALVAHFMMPGDNMTFKKTVVILFGITGVVLVSLSKDPDSISGNIGHSAAGGNKYTLRFLECSDCKGKRNDSSTGAQLSFHDHWWRDAFSFLPACRRGWIRTKTRDVLPLSWLVEYTFSGGHFNLDRVDPVQKVLPE